MGCYKGEFTKKLSAYFNDITSHFGNALLPDKNVPWHTALYMREADVFANKHGFHKDKVWRSWEPGLSKLFLNDLEYRFNVEIISKFGHSASKCQLSKPAPGD